ncbi:MAG: hypothetical protein U0230_20045 [Polyangiales bacterium]
MSASLIVYQPGVASFSVDEAERMLERMGCTDVKTGGVCLVDGIYWYEGDSVFVRVVSKEGDIAVGGLNEVAFRAVLGIRAALSRDIRVIDQGYTFDVAAGPECSLEELLAAADPP